MSTAGSRSRTRPSRCPRRVKAPMAEDPVLTQSGQLVAFWLERISLKSHRTWIETEMQPARDDVALRAHRDVLHRGIDVASGAFQGAAFEDSACTSFGSQHLHDA